MMPRPYRVGVVGFGVAGGAVSFLLARDGHEVSLFERAPQVGPVGAGILLQPSGQWVLREVGLFDKVAALGEPIEELYALTHRGGTLLKMPYAAFEPGACAWGLHRGDLFTVLHEQVAAHGVRVHLDHEMQSCRAAGGEVYLSDARGREYGPFDFVLAADGARSQLRGASRLRKWVHDYGYAAMWLIGRCTAVSRRLHQVTRGTSHLIGLLPMGGGRCSLFWGLHRREAEAVRKRGVAAWREQVVGLCPLAAELFDGLTDFGPVVLTTYQHVWMRRWHDDRVLFLGDAGHAMSPHLGQGVNLALIDAHTFASCLRRSADHREAFREFVRRRERQLRFFSWVTLLLTPFFQSDGWVKGWGRDVVLPLMPKVPWVRRQMAMTMAGVKGGFLAGRMKL
jgi:2-polyprenyl-6-methoxyphenol hydroxylase-like FAD-dependent oxidoreductase